MFIQIFARSLFSLICTSTCIFIQVQCCFLSFKAILHPELIFSVINTNDIGLYQQQKLRAGSKAICRGLFSYVNL